MKNKKIPLKYKILLGIFGLMGMYGISVILYILIMFLFAIIVFILSEQNFLDFIGTSFENFFHVIYLIIGFLAGGFLMYFLGIKFIKKILNKHNVKITSLKITLILFLLLLILVGIFGAFCGGVFMITELINGVSNIEQISFYEVSIPSFIIGLIFIIIGYFGMKKRENILKFINRKIKK